MNQGLKFTSVIILLVILIVSSSSLFVKNKDPIYYSVLSLIIISILFILFTANRIYEKYLEDDPILVEIRKLLAPLFPDEINSIVLLKGKKSFTINKKQVYLCLKDHKGDYYELNMLIYVAIHEFAHVRCKEVGHTADFHKIFKEMLQTAIDAGVYNDRIPIVSDYCNY